MILSKFKSGDSVIDEEENEGVVIEKQYFEYLDIYVYLVQIDGCGQILRENELDKVIDG